MFLLVLLSILLIAGCAGQVLEKNAEHIDETKEFEIGVHAFAERMQENPNAVLLDVREPEEYEEEHIEGAVLLPL
ncbi:MAG: rhodanese-like domain-containing protein, partial [Nitrosopumilus sp.]